MKPLFILFISLISVTVYTQEKTILFFQTDWGRTASWDTFCEKTKAAGYDGIEIWLPKEKKDQINLKAALEKYNLKVAFLNGTNKAASFNESLKAYEQHLQLLTTWSPVFINCHTGSDFFSFEQNKTYIDVANKIANESGIPIYHETHRGRFSYSLPETITYTEKIPQLRLNLDISHWMVVHESLLEGKDDLLKPILNRTNHLHARVGHAEGPQVNDPQAPEWKKAVDRHLDIWEIIIRENWKNKDVFTITTEFGPPTYMPTLPFTKLPVADQWKANIYMMNVIKERMNLE